MRKRIISFFSFLIHKFNANDFDIQQKKANLALLWRQKKGQVLDANRKGKLFLLTTPRERLWFWIKNALYFGACSCRVRQVIYLTFTTYSLELLNPLNVSSLKPFIERKVAYLKRLLNKIELNNPRNWNTFKIRVLIDQFHRSSWLQLKVIQEMHRAYRRQSIKESVEEGQRAIDQGLYPVLVTSGCSGSYWIRGEDRTLLGLFKPFDEEFYGPNNPVGPRLQGALGARRGRRGCRAGESAHHEVAAFIVDNFLGFGIVPKTYYASFSHRSFFFARSYLLASHQPIKTKFGSFQEFVDGFISLKQLPKEEYIRAIPVVEFQLLVLLDVILGNCDRNMGNILIGDEKLAAIDHGLCFPDIPDKFTTWYWRTLEYQAKIPLFAVFVELLKEFPLEQLGWKLKKNCCISESSINRMRERIALFKAGILAGMTPFELAPLMIPSHFYRLMELDATLESEARTIIEEFKNKNA